VSSLDADYFDSWYADMGLTHVLATPAVRRVMATATR